MAGRILSRMLGQSQVCLSLVFLGRCSELGGGSRKFIERPGGVQRVNKFFMDIATDSAYSKSDLENETVFLFKLHGNNANIIMNFRYSEC